MKIFIDLGAYDGDTIKKAMELHPDRDLYYAFEPLPQNFKKLSETFEKFPNVKLYNQAAGIKDGKIDFFLHKDSGKRPGADEGGTTEKSKNNVDTKHPIRVETVDFSRFVKENITESDDVILKIDIEGTEYDVLEKMIADNSIQLINKIYCEWHKHKVSVSEKRHSSLIKKLNELGFQLTGKNEDDEFSKVRKQSSFSIVIATYNRKDVLKQLLDSLKLQTDDDFEVVVAVDGSRDGTIEMLDNYRINSPFELRYVDTGLTNEYGLAVARNMGIREARGKAVVILDDDSFPVPNFVKEHKRTVTKKTLTGGGRLSTDPKDTELRDKMKMYLETFGDSSPQKFKPVPKYKWVIENNTCMYKEDWIESGLFDESIREYGSIGQTFNTVLIRKGFLYQFNPRAAINHHVEYRQNSTYKKKNTDTKINTLKTLLRKRIPFFYTILKKVKNYIEYR